MRDTSGFDHTVSWYFNPHYNMTARTMRNVLVDAIVELQNAEAIRQPSPILMANLIWALVHGTAPIVIDGESPEPAQKPLSPIPCSP